MARPAPPPQPRSRRHAARVSGVDSTGHAGQAGLAVFARDRRAVAAIQEAPVPLTLLTDSATIYVNNVKKTYKL